jgi:cell pole-organizing protein PopZ
MSNAAKAHEPSMEEILASIRRIIADDEPAAETAAEAKPAPAKAAKPAPAAAPKAEPEAETGGELGQDDIDAMLASFDSPPVPGKEPEPEADEEDDVLELKKPAPKAAEVDFVEKAAEPEEDLAGWGMAAEEEAPPPPPRPVASVPEAAAVSRQVGDVLLGAESGAAVASAFSSLAHTILQQNARTLDDLVEEMLRPMLKGWLDDNLPGIVERLVRAEIERVSRGPRR